MTSPSENTPNPPPRITQLETDTFCTGCWYNLYGQLVTRDPTLGILVCRCPECGRFHPAGIGVSADQIWLSRVGRLALVAWVLLCLFFLLVDAIIMGSMMGSFLAYCTTIQYLAPDGQPVEWSYNWGSGQTTQPAYGWVYSGTTQPSDVTTPIAHRLVTYGTPQPMSAYAFSNYMYNPQSWSDFAPYVITLPICAVIFGVFVSVIFAHARRRARWALLIPIIVGLFVGLFWSLQPAVGQVALWSISWIAAWTVFDMLFVALGLRFGRPLARLLLNITLPPAPRQHFAFLWFIDGLPAPPMPHPSPPVGPAGDSTKSAGG